MINRAYQNLLSNIISVGTEQGKTIQAINVSFAFPMSTCLITIPKCELDYEGMLLRAHWLLSGSDTSLSTVGSNRINLYGSRLLEGTPQVVNELSLNRSTTKAIIYLGQLGADIISFQFLLVDHNLTMVVNMREADCWNDLPYHCFFFGAIARSVLLYYSLKGFGLGQIHVNIGSGYIRENDQLESSVVVSNDLQQTRNIVVPYEFKSKVALLNFLLTHSKRKFGVKKGNELELFLKDWYAI